MPVETFEHFSQFPNLISLLESPEYEPVPIWGRIRKSGGEDFFFSETIGTKSTIPHCLMLKKVVLQSLAKPSQLSFGTQNKSEPPASTISNILTTPDTVMLLELSSPGVCSHPSTAHGGLISTILDEAMAHTLVSHFPFTPGKVDDIRKTLFTSRLEVIFKRPVWTPGVLIVKSWCVASKGRKYWMKAQAIQLAGVNDQLQDQEEVKCEASGIWIKSNSNL
ncbi:hypothetical protein V8C42DRAFT_363952 [Trichoderma barbatum]